MLPRYGRDKTGRFSFTRKAGRQVQIDLSQVSGTTQHISAGMIALLVVERIAQVLRYRNGGNRRMTTDTVRNIVHEELQPIERRLDRIGETVAAVAALQNVQAFKASQGGR